MGIRALIGGLTALLATLLIGGCARHDYVSWIMLPPSARLVEKEFYREDGYQPQEQPAAGRSGHAFSPEAEDISKEKIKFELPGGWLPVAEFYDEELARRGFKLVEGDALTELRSGASLDFKSILNYRSYASERQPEIIVLYDATRFNQALFGDPDTDPASSDTFALIIVKLQ